MKQWLLWCLLLASSLMMAQIVAPTDLTGSQSAEDAVTLYWNEPVLPFDGYDDFESQVVPEYFSIFNVNGGNTWGIQANGYESDYCISCMYDNPNNDWLVSPELAVTASSQFSFMAGNSSATYAQESFNVYINSVGPEVENFTGDPTLSYTFPADAVAWESFTVELGEYADQNIWIAIQSTSVYMEYLKIDNYSVTNLAAGRDLVITAEDSGNYYRHIESTDRDKAYSKLIERDIRPGTYNSRAFLGYNVYRDAVQINTETIATTSYVDSGLATGTYEYHVTAVFDEGESESTNTVSVVVTSVQDADEGFESGDMAMLPWVFPAEGTWSASDVNPFSGTYCAKTDSLADNSAADLSVTLNILEAGNIMFASKASNELDYDYLSFYIDGVLQNQISGDTEWILPVVNSFPVTVGLHTFSWIFAKDANTIGGEDCAWLDHITFPEYAAFGSISGTVENSDAGILADVAISLENGMYSASSDASGNFGFPALPAGTYSVTATLGGYYEYSGSVDVIVEQNTVFDIVMNPLTAVINGTVTNDSDELLENVSISLEEGMYTVVSGTDGTFEFPTLPAGIYSVTATLDNYYEFSGSVEAIDGQNTILDIVLNPLAAAAVTGTIKDIALGTAISGALVSLSGETYLTTETDVNGEFEIVLPGSDQPYYLAIYAPGYQGHYETLTISGALDMGNMELTELLYPATGITAVNNGGNAELAWETPQTSLPDYFRYDNGLTGWGTGTSNIVGSPNHLMGNVFYTNAIINNVEFCMFDYSTSGPHENKAKVVIYGLGEDGYPDGDRLIHESEWLDVMEGYNQWNYYELPEAVEAPNGYIVGLRGNEAVTTEFWVAYSYAEYTPDWPAQYGDSYRIYDMLADEPFFTPVDSGDSYSHILIRANGFCLEELDNRPSATTRATDNSFSDAPGNRNIADVDRVISNFGNSYPTTSRSVESYDIWRLKADDSEDNTLWTEVTTDVNETTYVDNNFSTETTGTYQFAIYANYTGDLQSGAKFSNCIGRDMLANVNLNVTTANGSSTENARIRLYGDDQYAPALGFDYYEFYMGDNNSLNQDIWKQTYKIYVDLEGYEQYIQESVYVFGDTDIDIILVDMPVPAYGVNVETIETGETITWLPAEEKVLLDHHGPLAETGAFLMDYPVDDWNDFDREGVFDIVIEEPVVLSKLVLPVKIFWDRGQNYPAEFYPEPVTFSIKVYENEGGTPAVARVDSSSTIPVVFNDFNEYSAVLENPIVLQPGTYWIGAQPQLPPYPAWPDAPEGHFCRVSFARTLDLHNGSGYFWRMPYDGYDMGYDVWYQYDTDLQVYVVGRPLTSETRSVDSYDIYRLDEDADVDDLSTWDEIELGCENLSSFDNTIDETGIYRYAIIANFPNGPAEAAFSAEEMLEPPVVSGENPAVTMVTALKGNYPNPFNPTTTISFSLKEEGEVSLEIYNVKGQKVKTMKQEMLSAGNHTMVWQGTDDDEHSVSSGIYFYKMHSRNYTATKKMILMK